MNSPLEIAFHNLQSSPSIEAELRKHVDKLEIASAASPVAASPWRGCITNTAPATCLRCISPYRSLATAVTSRGPTAATARAGALRQPGYPCLHPRCLLCGPTSARDIQRPCPAPIPHHPAPPPSLGMWPTHRARHGPWFHSQQCRQPTHFSTATALPTAGSRI